MEYIEFYDGQFESWYDDFSAIAPGLVCEFGDSVELEILASKLNRWIRNLIKGNK